VLLASPGPNFREKKYNIGAKYKSEQGMKKTLKMQDDPRLLMHHTAYLTDNPGG
jgi:hypothetical protein